MSLVRIERLTVNEGPATDISDNLPQSPRRRLSEDFYVQNRVARLCRNSIVHDHDVCSISKIENDCLSSHLPLIIRFLRPMDNLKSAIMLQTRQSSPLRIHSNYRYLCIICCHPTEDVHGSDPCKQNKELVEHALLGVDVLELSQDKHFYRVDNETGEQQSMSIEATIHEEKEGESLTKESAVPFSQSHQVTVGLFLPISMDLQLCLDGDGGFKINTKHQEFHFKPENVASLWNVVQQINKAISNARMHQLLATHSNEGNNWYSYYNDLYTRDSTQHRYRILEWQRLEDIETHREDVLAMRIQNPTERQAMEMKIAKTLREIMYSQEDLDSISVVELRLECENRLQHSLSDFKQFISKEIMIIYGQMDQPSKILDYLYLGSTYNASNLEDLEEKNVTHILNVTREVDNFFADIDKFHYMNVRIYDYESSQLMNMWTSTHAFIKRAESNGTCCLVHCQRGISRSASTVIAFVMKEKNWNLETAFNYVKSCRNCIQPNPGFMEQLKTYEGILKANQRFIHHHSKSSLKSTSDRLSNCLNTENDLDDDITGVEKERSLDQEESDVTLISDNQEVNNEIPSANTGVRRYQTMPARDRPPLLQKDSIGPDDDEFKEPLANDSSKLISTIPAGTVNSRLREIESRRQEQEQNLEMKSSIGRTSSLNQGRERQAAFKNSINPLSTISIRVTPCSTVQEQCPMTDEYGDAPEMSYGDAPEIQAVPCSDQMEESKCNDHSVLDNDDTSSSEFKRQSCEDSPVHINDVNIPNIHLVKTQTETLTL